MEYIVHYEVWRDGRPIKWGNFSLTAEGEVSSEAVLGAIQDRAAMVSQCETSEVRLVGLFKL